MMAHMPAPTSQTVESQPRGSSTTVFCPQCVEKWKTRHAVPTLCPLCVTGKPVVLPAHSMGPTPNPTPNLASPSTVGSKRSDGIHIAFETATAAPDHISSKRGQQQQQSPIPSVFELFPSWELPADQQFPIIDESQMREQGGYVMSENPRYELGERDFERERHLCWQVQSDKDEGVVELSFRGRTTARRPMSLRVATYADAPISASMRASPPRRRWRAPTPAPWRRDAMEEQRRKASTWPQRITGSGRSKGILRRNSEPHSPHQVQTNAAIGPKMTIPIKRIGQTVRRLFKKVESRPSVAVPTQEQRRLNNSPDFDLDSDLAYEIGWSAWSESEDAYSDGEGDDKYGQVQSPRRSQSLSQDHPQDRDHRQDQDQSQQQARHRDHSWNDSLTWQESERLRNRFMEPSQEFVDTPSSAYETDEPDESTFHIVDRPDPLGLDRPCVQHPGRIGCCSSPHGTDIGGPVWLPPNDGEERRRLTGYGHPDGSDAAGATEEAQGESSCHQQ